MSIPLPKDFRFATCAAGFKKSERPDLALCYSDTPATLAATFTTNRFQAAPVLVGKERLQAQRLVRGVVINAGQANACTGAQGLADCHETLRLLASALDVPPEELLPASTGVIGTPLLLDKWRDAVPKLVADLGHSSPEAFARAIMTTDAFPKLAWSSMPWGNGDSINVLGIAKGAGMICPNMATMLAVVLCDAVVPQSAWQEILNASVKKSFNQVTVDGDTSTNDTVYGLANGASNIDPLGEDLFLLADAVGGVCSELAEMLVADAEGGSKVITITVQGAMDHDQAENVARTVGHSPLVKTAFYGRDPNWGRIVAAIGRAQAQYEPEDVQVILNNVPLFMNGQPTACDAKALLGASLRKRAQHLLIVLGHGPGDYELRAADLTHDYVSLNAEYTT